MDTVGVPWRSRALQTVLVSTLVLPLGVPLLSPLLPLYGEVFAVSDLRASLLISLYFLPVVLLSPVVGIALDEYGRRPVLIASLAAFGAIGVGMMGIASFQLLLLARFAQGAAAAGVFCATVTIVADSFDGIQRNAVFGVNVAVLATGRAIYPLLGGFLARAGWSLPFATYALAILVAGFVFVGFPQPAEGRSPRPLGPLASSVAAVKSGPVASLIGVTIAAEVVTFGVVYTSVPFMLGAAFAATPVTIGGVLTATTVAAAVTAAGNGRLARRVSSPDLVALGFVLFGASLLALGVAPGVLATAGVAVVFGAGVGLVLPSVDAAISDTVVAETRASAMSLRNSATGIGKAAGPAVFAGAATVADYRTLMFVAAVASLAVGAVGLCVARR